MIEDKATVDIMWVLIGAVLVFLMQAGFLTLETGLTRSKNNINVAIKNLADFGISTVLYWAFGFALMFGLSRGGWFGSSAFAPDFGPGKAWLLGLLLVPGHVLRHRSYDIVWRGGGKIALWRLYILSPH